jgi:O-antigen/teichoic acid export membrane protein
LFNSITYLVASVAFSLLLIPPWGLEGAAWAGALTVILLNSIRLVQVYVLIHKSTPFNLDSLKPLGAAVIAGGGTALLQPIVFPGNPLAQLVVLSLVMLALYGTSILLFRLSYEDRLVLERLWKGILKRGKGRKREGRTPEDGRE